MTWEIVFCDQFDDEFDEFDQELKIEISAVLTVLEEHGPNLGRPYVDHIKRSRYKKMKELRVQYKGSPYRYFFIFDINRCAVVLCGGCKENDDEFYSHFIRIAEERYNYYLKQANVSTKN